MVIGEKMKKRLLVHPEELTRKKIDIFKDLGLEIVSLHPAGGETAHESLEKMLSMLEDEKFRGLIDYIKESGMEVEYEMHAASFLLPRELFDAHPEYFRMDENGNRVRELNLCASNEEAIDICVKNAIKLVGKLYRSNHTYYIWLDDVDGKCCKCEKCSKISSSTQTLKIMNRILKELKKEISDARLAYLAYHDTMEVPDGEAEEGVFLEYAPIERNFEKGASGMTETEKEKLVKLLDFFGKENASVLEYWYDNSFLSNWKKPPRKFVPDNEIIKKDIEFYKNLGFDNIGSFACFLGDDYEKLWGEVDYSAFKKN